MLQEIKKIKIKELKEDLEETKNELKKGKYNLLERTVTKVKAYKKWLLEMQQKIKIIEENIEKIEKSKGFIDLNITLEQGMEILLSHGIEPVLTEEEISQVYRQRKPDVDNFEGLIIIHKFDHPIRNGIIETCNSIGITKKIQIKIGNEVKEIKIQNHRNTIHFSINGEAGNAWNNCRYAVLIPMQDFLASDDDKQKFNLCPGSTYRSGDLTLTPNSWIIAPQSEIEEIKKDNPNINVIGYQGSSVTKYAELLIKMLGYKTEEISSYRWKDIDDENKYQNFISKMGYKAVDHIESDEMYTEKMAESMELLGAYIDYIVKNPEILNNPQMSALLATQIATVLQPMPTMKTSETIITDLCNSIAITYNILLPVETLKNSTTSSACNIIGKLILIDLKNKYAEISKETNMHK